MPENTLLDFVKRYKATWIEYRILKFYQTQQGTGREFDDQTVRKQFSEEADRVFGPIERALLTGQPLQDALQEFLKRP